MLIIYDHQCPFCANYVRLVRLRQAVGALTLISARSADPRVRQLKLQGFDLDRGMAVVMGGTVYFGADALHLVSVLSSATGIFNRINKMVFSSCRAAHLLYPAFRAARRVALKIRGVPPVDGS